RLLMEAAGRAVAQEALRVLRAAKVGRAVTNAMDSDSGGNGSKAPSNIKEIESWKRDLARAGGTVCVICGPGNNGGDGFVVSRALLNQGVAVRTFFIGAQADIRAGSDAGVNHALLKRYGHDVRYVMAESDAAELRQALDSCEVAVDAIFGTGLTREVVDFFRQAIETMNTTKAIRVSVDIPSGLDANAGNVLGVAVKADITVTFAIAKHGLLKGAGPEYCGRLSVVDIGIPRPLIEEILRQEAGSKAS
ncbi:MAG: NAD(P)H-hydrate epimerase, partial [Planctomycetes bacterium]|nr:NAD(P)H-hydrate epimerase [Planctomycetota bacterium]